MESMKIILSTYCVLTLPGCGNAEPEKVAASSSHQAELQAFIDSIKADLVFIEGGDFLMGDFGPEYGPERLPYDTDEDSKPLHKIVLTSFSMERFKVTNERYQFFLEVNNIEPRLKGMANQEKWDSLNSIPNTPAHIDWYEAERYCQWLEVVTKLPFALPSEAQWEYAARSRGQYLVVATDDGSYRAEPRSLRTDNYSPKGVNISSDGDREVFARRKSLPTGTFTPLPVDRFPPNPLGLYSMSDNGYEWVNDWYDPDYYKKSPLEDPKGPGSVVFNDQLNHGTKVTRGQNYADPYWGGGVNVFRTAADPYGRVRADGTSFIADKTMRCVVNSPAPIEPPSSTT
jgi:formylglycine-generating enzyme required for sulfatase activity